MEILAEVTDGGCSGGDRVAPLLHLADNLRPRGLLLRDILRMHVPPQAARNKQDQQQDAADDTANDESQVHVLLFHLLHRREVGRPVKHRDAVALATANVHLRLLALDAHARHAKLGGRGGRSRLREIALDVAHQRLVCRIAHGRLQLEHAHDDRVDLRRYVRTHLARLQRSALEARAHHRVRVLALERRLAGERMVERAAQRVDVSAEVDLLAAALLRRDVVWGAPYLVGVALHRSEAEVHQLGRAVLGVEHVLWLHVAVNESLLRGKGERVHELLADAHHAHRVKAAWIGLHVLVERPAGHQLHRDVRHALLLSEGVYLGYVRMVEPRGRLRLALEALDELRVGPEFLQHDLDGHLAVEHLVARKVHAAHAAVAQLLLEQKVPEIGRCLNHRFFSHLVRHHILLFRWTA